MNRIIVTKIRRKIFLLEIFLLLIGIAEQFRKFQSAKDAKIHLSLSTLGGEFDGSGYYADIILDEMNIITIPGTEDIPEIKEVPM